MKSYYNVPVRFFLQFVPGNKKTTPFHFDLIWQLKTKTHFKILANPIKNFWNIISNNSLKRWNVETLFTVYRV